MKFFIKKILIFIIVTVFPFIIVEIIFITQKDNFLDEKNFACPPQHLSGKDRPFLVHFKGKYNKELIKKYFLRIHLLKKKIFFYQ